MSKKKQGDEVTDTVARPIPGRRTRAVLFALAVVAGLAIGGGAALAVGSFQNASEQEVAGSVENFDDQVAITNAAFSALESHIDEGNTVLTGVDADAVETGVTDDLTAAVTEAREFADDHENRSADADGLDVDEVDALTSGLAELANTADQHSTALVDAVAAVSESEQAFALSASADDLDDATKNLQAAVKKAKKVLEESEGHVLTEKGRTKLSDEIEAAQKTLDEDVNRDDVDEMAAATKAYKKTAKSVAKARKTVSEEIEAYEAGLKRQAEVEAARPAEPTYEPPPPEPEQEPEAPDPSPEASPSPDKDGESDDEQTTESEPEKSGSDSENEDDTED